MNVMNNAGVRFTRTLFVGSKTSLTQVSQALSPFKKELMSSRSIERARSRFARLMICPMYPALKGCLSLALHSTQDAILVCPGWVSRWHWHCSDVHKVVCESMPALLLGGLGYRFLLESRLSEASLRFAFCWSENHLSSGLAQQDQVCWQGR